MIKLYYGIVVDNNSENKDRSVKDSYIKVRVIPELKDIGEDNLPWVRPFTGLGMGASLFGHNPPEINDNVWILFKDEPYWKEGYYIPGRYIDGLFDYTKWNDSDVPDKNPSTYPNPRFWYIPDGSIFFVDYDTGDKGVYNSNGSYLLIKGTGEIYLYTKNKSAKIYNDNGYVEVDTGGIINLSGNTKNLVTHAELATALNTFVTALNVALGTKSDGTGSPGTLSININPASATKVKTS